MSRSPSSKSTKYNVDDYEDFGYEVKNAKRYSNKQKQQRKFKDYYHEED